tara:strand:+ start:639 stop:923 length:285 start_codon:yes stop_codon:yes gene_type:complete
MKKKNIIHHSESLLLSLSKEIEYIKSRSKNINDSIKTCQNKILLTRLNKELRNLNKNRLKISKISQIIFNSRSDDLSVELLFEITKRSNYLQQI